MGKVLSIAEFPIILLAGILGQAVAGKLWERAFGDQAPDTAQREVRWPLLIAAGVAEGIFYKFFRMAVDRGIRTTIHRTTGTWPGRPGQGE